MKRIIVYSRNTIVVFILLFLGICEGNAQVESDTVERKEETLPEETSPKYKDPNKALWLSLLLPGAGQVYNEKVWKLPILYGGVITSIYFLEFNNRRYQRFLVALDIIREGTEPNPFPNLNQDGIVRNVNYWRRNRDAIYLVFGAIYAFGAVDAFVDAHLAGFDVSDDLSFKIEPSVEPIMASSASVGISLKIKF
ncbi:DUF5683 domain-containing protein [Negadavirga shengliensis]|uniref:DUF5683 domain-containing protein n=1 Tax=Negadavirga shengliensis TaxID=1389218 RepID=A0ABV9T692_9BACT